ncbi:MULTISPECIES: hypothetical protein [Staphylococcus]|uniref:Uncharacterized protein n=1 Tax=Staphylococcus pettenkoferi TaxID=170573 RepID=A0ABT4BIH2_9STAP|nr:MULTISPECIES: hypothetical protein [Staphylococcus]EHM71310.1 hypothetical protein SEVCU012_1442 [Staphylococcus pettenkoferi VCU012]MCI2790591.1 hypothetical protein [Staphylococcus pettenkoferi]MCI2803102.1 hypothetical protein [Staphylococcus pettenkoferi]MCY1564686.1 hypothetical protein [Staphylococcus pettenkoferi]MCY1566253.1 hypothetical protein [Staphylococcus pettenkoferi]
MSEQSKAKKADEQAKAQNLFARWRKDETLYKEDEKDNEKEETDSDNQNKDD